jgi:hypothetical protein
MYKPPENPSDVKRITKHRKFNTDDLILKNSTFRELISTGNMDVLSDQKTKVAILDYYHLGENIASQIKEFNLFSTRVMTDVIANVPSFSNPMRRELHYDLGMELFKDQKSEKFLAVEQVVSVYKMRNMEDLEHFQELKIAAEQLIIQIQNESLLKKNKPK